MLGINYPLCQLTSRFEVLKYIGDFLPTPQMLMHQYHTDQNCNYYQVIFHIILLLQCDQLGQEEGGGGGGGVIL